MPIRELSCDACGKIFEELIMSQRDRAALMCPKCGRKKLTELFSVFGVSGTEKKVQTSAKSCKSCNSHSCSTCG